MGPDSSKTTFLEQDFNRNNLLCGSRPWVHVCQHVAYNLRDSKFPRSLCMDEHHVKKSYSIYAEASLKSLFRPYLIQDKYQLYLFRTQLVVYDTFIFYVHTCIQTCLFCLCFVSFFKKNVRATTHMTVLYQNLPLSPESAGSLYHFSSSSAKEKGVSLRLVLQPHFPFTVARTKCENALERLECH